jgi:prefoldin subunit 5
MANNKVSGGTEGTSGGTTIGAAIGADIVAILERLNALEKDNETLKSNEALLQATIAELQESKGAVKDVEVVVPMGERVTIGNATMDSSGFFVTTTLNEGG